VWGQGDADICERRRAAGLQFHPDAGHGGLILVLRRHPHISARYGLTVTAVFGFVLVLAEEMN